MTTVSGGPTTDQGVRLCGCCGRQLRVEQLVELGSTPGVFICDQCALWAARRSSRMPVVSLDPRRVVRRLRSMFETSDAPGKVAPILTSADLGRTADFYRHFGMEETARYDGYLIMRRGHMELHFSVSDRGAGEVFVEVPDAGRLWKRFRSERAPGLGLVEDRPYGLREFVVTDPDGNRIRIGSVLPSQ